MLKKLLLILTLVVIVASCGNRELSDFCDSELNSSGFFFFNNSYQYNCGHKEYAVHDVETIYALCEEISSFEKINPFTSTKVNYWYVDVKIDESNWTKDYITVINTVNHGFVMKIGTSVYRNDDFAELIVEILEIQETDAMKPCGI